MIAYAHLEFTNELLNRCKKIEDTSKTKGRRECLVSANKRRKSLLTVY